MKRIMIVAAAMLVAAPVSAAEVVFSGVSPTSDDYQLGVVWSGLAKELGIPMTVVENGTVAGMRKAAQGEVDMVGVGAPHYLDAVNGTGKYTDDPERLREAYKDMKAVLAMPVGMAQYVARAGEGIDTFADLKGKTVGIGRPGGNAGKISQTLFAIHDMEGEVDGRSIEYGPALEQMAAGTMDATLVWGSLPTAAIDNASRQMDLRFISPDPDTLEEFRAALSNGEYYVYQRIPAASIERAYEGRVAADEDAHFWTFPYQVMVRGDVDEDTVYELTKALWENIDKVNEASAGLSLISKEGALEALSADLHPGAARYYSEQGMM